MVVLSGGVDRSSAGHRAAWEEVMLLMLMLLLLLMASLRDSTKSKGGLANKKRHWKSNRHK
jgi:hypothetical protein